MPKKSAAADEKPRGTCSMEVVKRFLQSDIIPEGYTKNDRRVLQRRAKSFVLVRDELYFTGGRSRHCKGLIDYDGDGVEIPQKEADHTQFLRKVVFSLDEQREIINKAHVRSDGSHYGMEKTTEQVSNQYYWLGITYAVRDTIFNCPKCSSRIKNPGRTRSFETDLGTSNTSVNTRHIASSSTMPARRSDVSDYYEEEEGDDNGDEGDETEEDNELSPSGLAETHSVKQEVSAGSTKDVTGKKKIRSYLGQKSWKITKATKRKVTKVSKKSPASDDREWGSCSSLESVKQYLLSNTIPESYNRNDKRVLLRRAKSFVLIKGELYFTGGRSKHKKGSTDSEAGDAENSENESNHTQLLRKVVFSEEERRAILNSAHIGIDGSHNGMERTTEQVSNHYYWLGITYGVRNTILACPKCSSRSKNPNRSLPFETDHGTTFSKHSRMSGSSDVWDAEAGEGADDSDVSEDNELSEGGFSNSRSVKQEVESAPADSLTGLKSRKSSTTESKKETKSPKKPTTLAAEKERGSCCSLEAVKQYLLSNKIPESYDRNDKRALLRRAKSFVMIKDDLYFTGGRSRHNKGLFDSEDGGAENPENEPDHTQILRKVVFSEEEQKDILLKAHIGEDGAHHGVEKTTEQVSNNYYWLGITYGVRNTILACLSCSSRMKNPGRSLSFPTEFGTTSTFFSNNVVGITAASTSATKSSESANVWDEDMDDAHEDGGDLLDDVNEENNGLSEYGLVESHGLTESQSVKQEMGTWPVDTISAAKEVCNYFWQKVEIQMFGPYQAGKKLVYVAVALDSYSQFPEAVTMEVLSSATLTNFLLNLFCRYGVMEKVLLLQNQVIKNKELFINTQDLQQAGISPSLLCPHVNTLDERWIHIEKSLIRFVSLYPEFWFHCLEAFMVPLRITLPPEAIYSPYYLVHGREPPVPDKLSQLCKVNTSAHAEIQLTEDQEKQTVEMITAAYGIYSDNPSVPVTLPEPSPAKESTKKDSVVELEKPQQEKSQRQSRDIKTRSEQKRRRGRPRLTEREEIKEMSEKEETAEEELTNMEVEEAPDIDDDGGSEAEDDSDKDATYRPDTKHIIKKSPLITKRKRGRPRKIACSEIGAVPDFTRMKFETKKMPTGLQSSIIKNLQKLSLDAFYFILKQYLEHDVFPPGISGVAKQTLSRLGLMFTIKEGKLYSSVGKSAGRLIILGEKTRISLLRKAHARGEVHHGRTSVLKYLSDQNVFWNGMSLDVDAFIHSCPECICNNPLGNLPVVRIPSKSAILMAEGKMEDEPHFSEDEEEESSYEDLIQYLTDNTFSPSTTSQQQQRIQQRSQSFCIINGSLYYQTHRMSEPRQVLFSETLKHSAIQDAHIENNLHLSQQDTQARLRRQHFWSGMTFDVLKHVMTCCMQNSLSTPPVLHRNPVIQERVSKIRSYYTGGMIPILDTSAIMAAEVKSSQTADASARIQNEQVTGGKSVAAVDNSGTSLSKHSLPLIGETAAREMLEEALAKAVENIIESMDKSLSAKKKAETSENNEGNTSGQSPFGNVRSQKVPHKCQFCGKYIGGNVAYKIHLYKHTGVKPFTCSTCGKSFTTNRSLLVHNRKHTGIRPYLCNQCGRGFFRSASLHYHLKAHAIGKGTPVSCDVCGRTFSTQHRLNRHKEFKHPVHAKVYMCNQCGKNFTAARSLKRHEQIHTGHRKYQCHYCSKSFFRKEYLNAHLTNHAEYEPDLDKLKPREKTKKPQHQSKAPPNAIHWTESEQVSRRLEEPLQMTNLDTYQRQNVSVQPILPSSHATSSHISHLPSSSVMAHSQMVHHPLHYPITHSAHLMNVAGPHGPLPLTMPSARPPVDVLQAGNSQENLMQHDAVPVQYGVECVPGEAPNLSEADLNAIHMLAQATISGPSLHNM